MACCSADADADGFIDDETDDNNNDDVKAVDNDGSNDAINNATINDDPEDNLTIFISFYALECCPCPC